MASSGDDVSGSLVDGAEVTSWTDPTSVSGARSSSRFSQLSGRTERRPSFCISSRIGLSHRGESETGCKTTKVQAGSFNCISRDRIVRGLSRLWHPRGPGEPPRAARSACTAFVVPKHQRCGGYRPGVNFEEKETWSGQWASLGETSGHLSHKPVGHLWSRSGLFRPCKERPSDIDRVHQTL